MTGHDPISYSKELDSGKSGLENYESLIRECIDQKRAAQKKLYDQFSPFLYGVIRRYVSDTHAAMEILNDTFYKIFTKIDTFSFSGSFEGWMRRIAVNTIMDHVRKNVKHEQVRSTEAERMDGYIPDDTIGKIAYKELLAIVHELPLTQRAVFNLFVFEQFSHKEIAEQLNITENNSRWHLNDARRRLKDKIKNMR